MAMPEDAERDLPTGGLLPARNLLDPGLFCQAVYDPELLLGAQVSELRPGKSHSWPDALTDGLQSSLAHPGGPEMPRLRSGTLNPDEPVMKSISDIREVTSYPTR